MSDRIVVMGVGYVGKTLLQSLIENDFDAIGFDVQNVDVGDLPFTLDHNEAFHDRNVFIVCVPTGLDDEEGRPNYGPIVGSMNMISRWVNDESTVIIESTIPPGITDMLLIPTLTSHSPFADIPVVYSPERVSPGDEEFTLKNQTKLVAATNAVGLKTARRIYGKVCKNVKVLDSIKDCEAAKIIENVQRDANIALMNELSEYLPKLGVNLGKALEGAKTKSNFYDVKPGLVGGHCIGVDTLYLLDRIDDVLCEYEEKPELISTVRKINENTIDRVREFITMFIKHTVRKPDPSIVIYGISYKPNVSDFRESASVKLIRELFNISCNIKAFDHVATNDDPSFTGLKIDITKDIIDLKKADIVIKMFEHGEQKLSDLIPETKPVIDIDTFLS